jgi:hypothetical protein
MSKPASSLTTEGGAVVGLARKAVPEACRNGLRIAPAGTSAAAASLGKRERTRAVARALGPPEVQRQAKSQGRRALRNVPPPSATSVR